MVELIDRAIAEIEKDAERIDLDLIALDRAEAGEGPGVRGVARRVRFEEANFGARWSCPGPLPGGEGARKMALATVLARKGV